MVLNAQDGKDLIVTNLFPGSIHLGTSKMATSPVDRERLTITHDGNVGINTTDPKDLLHISDQTVNEQLVYPAIRFSTVSTNALAQVALARLPGEFSNFAQPNDFVLRASYVANGPQKSDVIITARNPNGSIRFGTVDDSSGLTSDVQRLNIQNDGNIGIGIRHTQNAAANLHLYSTNWITELKIQSSGLYSSSQTPTSRLSFWAGNPGYQSSVFSPAIIQSVDDGNFTGALEFYTNGSGTSEKFGDPATGTLRQAMRIVNGSVGIGNVQPYNTRLLIKSSANANEAALKIVSGTLADLLFVGNNGFVGIGITQMQAACSGLTDARLAVDGLVVANEVRVRTECFPDFVFDPSYEPMPLDSLSSFVKQNRHLPGFPSERDVVDNGLEIGSMNVKLVQKVEELTLYMIQLKQDNEMLRERLEQIEERMKR